MGRRELVFAVVALRVAKDDGSRKIETQHAKKRKIAGAVDLELSRHDGAKNGAFLRQQVGKERWRDAVRSRDDAHWRTALADEALAQHRRRGIVEIVLVE